MVTFTEKATAELVDRIRRKLEELAGLARRPPQRGGRPRRRPAGCIDERARRRLREALFAFDRASISTIHAFCQRLLREHAFFNRRLFDEEAVDEEQAFEAAFAEVLRRDLLGDRGVAAACWSSGWAAAAISLKVKRAVLAAHRKLARARAGQGQRRHRRCARRSTRSGVLAAAAALVARPPALVKAALKAEKVQRQHRQRRSSAG